MEHSKAKVFRTIAYVSLLIGLLLAVCFATIDGLAEYSQVVLSVAVGLLSAVIFFALAEIITILQTINNHLHKENFEPNLEKPKTYDNTRTMEINITLYRDGEEIINKINRSFEAKTPLDETETKQIDIFLKQYKYNEIGSAENEEFVKLIEQFYNTNNLYQAQRTMISAPKLNDLLNDYHSIMKKFQFDYRINIR